ncbi:sulfotransferase [Actinocorallia sp. API 0066]|uniref:sulfotransferase family protein n=1 Tax=Actinocorallia sp. API 0066 TaxID=2896846 RepID=UPI001E4C0657|nr:sulfotransferase [Actinocorallia sp. API 0066]MCD0451882.1 sulfotransferase [Actinocorallia sp. API 0066]
MERPIFVVGCPRSGTTLLQLMLHAHPRIALPPETRFLLPAYFGREMFGDLTDRGNRRALGVWITGTEGHKFRDLGLDAARVVAEIEAGPPTLGSALGTVFRAYARGHDKARWGDKRPGYIRFLPEIFRLFPNAQVVHLIRDGRDCVGSLKGMRWWEHDSTFAMTTWAAAIDAGDRARRMLPPNSYHELQYERLVTDPESELRRLCGFLREDFDPAMLEPSSVASVTPRRKKHHRRTHEAVDASAVHAWQSRLEDWEISLAEYFLGERLARYGYELSGAPRPTARAATHYLATVAAMRRSRAAKDTRDAVRRLREHGELACRLDKVATAG